MWPQYAALTVACSYTKSLDERKRKRCVELLLLHDRPSERVTRAAYQHASDNRLIERAVEPPTLVFNPDGEIMIGVGPQ
eukprot:scaffold245946_cov27-Tisochrysis_lutea.AAC.1